MSQTRINFLSHEFEDMLADKEKKVKEEFSMEALQEIINLYTRAIEHFESQDDRRYKEYQNKMNQLLALPEILKKMNNECDNSFSTIKSNNEVDGDISDVMKDLSFVDFIGNDISEHRNGITNALDKCLNDFNIFVNEYLLQLITDHIHKLLDEKYQKYLKLSNKYQHRIKEIEVLFMDDIDAFKQGVQILRKEQENEMNKIDEQYKSLTDHSQEMFKNFAVEYNPKMHSIEEKFKLDISNLINSIFVDKNM